MKNPPAALCRVVRFTGWLFLAIPFSGATPGAVPPAITPVPAGLVTAPGTFRLSDGVTIRCGESALEVGRFLQRELELRGLRLALAPAGTAPAAQAIELAVVATAGRAESAESYRLHVCPDGVRLVSPSTAGLFYAVQSLLQWVDARRIDRGGVELEAVRIDDQPRFAWRGFLLDESRHFFGKAVVKQLLDVMGYLKLNRFHWHLTDDSGWRIEIKQYPELRTIGATGTWSDAKAPAAFYTQDDIREIVAYAAERHIVVVPEFDIPGHATAATRAYPELSGGGRGEWTGFTFNPAKENTYEFIAAVVREMAALFPGPYFHLGGDEVSYGNQSWSSDPEILQFMQANGLKNPHELEAYCVRRVAGIVRGQGKTPIGWDEIGAAGIPPAEATAMWWRHDKVEVLRALVAAGGQVILTPRLPCYFDFVQSAEHQSGRRVKRNGAFVDLASVHAFPDVFLGGSLPVPLGPNILGLQACAWTERIQSPGRLYFMTFPRLAALAEAAWSASPQKNYTGFLQRLPAFLRDLDRRKIPYFNPFEPAATPEPIGPAVKDKRGTANG